MSRRSALKGVSATLQGRATPGADWVEVVDLANQALITPALFRALEASGALTAVPQEVATFMAQVTALNDERNARLLVTFKDAVAALNGTGIEPTLLKGGALWAARSGTSPFTRMMTDLDLLVRPDEVERAIEALQIAGFGIMERYDDPSMHVAAELGRPSDVGAVDLHRRPPGPPYMAQRFEAERLPVSDWHGRVRVPSPAQQIYLMCLHDQFHDGGYWRGGFDLRHLHDLAELTRADGMDWGELERLMPTRLAGNAVYSELVAAETLAGAVLPESVRRRVVPTLQFHRHRAQHLHRALGVPLAGLGLLLEWRNIAEHRAANQAGWDAVSQGSQGRAGWRYRPERIKGLMKMRPGKI